MVRALRALEGIESIDVDREDGKLIVVGDVDPEALINCAMKIADTNIVSVEPATERLAEQHETEVNPGYDSGKEDKPGYESGKGDDPGYKSGNDDEA
ncbi:putative heavy metal-associated domain, HMA, heavy metal-associated domain superfamily [Helianthus annuus]|nr:putative heavy metal-associated domain, HMA, heavy metal-associated domain superfamily [Helianthus annuus]